IQLERFVELGDARGALLLNNSDWLRSLSLVDFLRDVGKHITVNEMIRKESVSTRLKRAEQGISYTEFSYMLLQAYDFLHLFDTHDCRLQLGGSDQYGNITMGIELVRKMRRGEVFGLTSPLVLKADGTKFGKTESGTLWLDAKRTSPYQLYQFFLRTEDASVASHLRFFTFLDHDEILELERATTENPERRQAQRSLAREVCTLVHGSGETDRAEHAASALFSEEIASLDQETLLDVCAEAPTTNWSRATLDGGITVVDALAQTGLARSKSQARTTVMQGGAYVNNRRVSDVDARIGRSDLLFDRYLVLRRGRRDYHLVRFV
ncbi:MAG: tyrosine--tRNA ligase, partial [Acidimicrobiales bacterium]